MRPSKVTKEQLAQYDQAHPDAPRGQAAQHFGVSDRYIRDLRAQLISASVAPAVPVRERPRLQRVGLPPYPTPPPRPRLVLATYMLCPRCDELMPPLPDDTVESWQRSGCHQCRVQPAKHLQQRAEQPAEAPEAEPEQHLTWLVELPEGSSGTTALQSDTSAVPVPAGGAQLESAPVEVASKPEAVTPATSAPVAVRTIVRVVYVRPGLATILDSVPPQVLLALVVSAVLIGLAAAGVR